MKFNFNENLVVDSIEKVPEDFRGLYAEADDGKFKLKTDDETVGAAVSAITRLNKALVASRGEATEAKKGKVDLSALSEYGETVEEITEGIKTALAEAGKGKTSKNVEEEIAKAVKAAKDALGETHGKELKAHMTKNEALQGQLFKLMFENEAVAALSKAKAVNPELALPFLRDQVKVNVNESSGEYVVNVVDSAGEIRYSGTTGDPMTVPERVAEMKTEEKFAVLFESEAGSGGGSKPTHRTTVTPTKKGDERTSAQKIEDGLKNRGHKIA